MEFYCGSSRKVPTEELSYPLHDDTVKVTTCGHVSLLNKKGYRVFLSTALSGERIGVRELDDGRCC